MYLPAWLEEIKSGKNEDNKSYSRGVTENKTLQRNNGGLFGH